MLAQSEGLIADAVYEASAVRGLLNIAKEGYFEPESKILLMHLYGSPTIHANANQFVSEELKRFPSLN